MPAETFADGITPEMLRLGLLVRDLNDLATEAYRVEKELAELVDWLAPKEITGAPASNDDVRDAFWDRFTTLVDEAAKEREDENSGA